MAEQLDTPDFFNGKQSEVTRISKTKATAEGLGISRPQEPNIRPEDYVRA
jgi:hypothetical protein